ncbi:MAG: hypothetical protein ACPLVJ_01715 [Candidatus Bathyarchaeales archaeon]
MRLISKVLLIIYGYGFIMFTINGFWMMGIPPGGFPVAFLFPLFPLMLPVTVYGWWYIAVPYFAVTLSLLWWWEKRKANVKVKDNMV